MDEKSQTNWDILKTQSFTYESQYLGFGGKPGMKFGQGTAMVFYGYPNICPEHVAVNICREHIAMNVYREHVSLNVL